MALSVVTNATNVNTTWGNSVVEAVNANTVITDALSAELQSLTDAEIQQLQNINSVTISNGQWTVLGGLVGTLTAAEVNFLDGVTSAIQTQLDAKAADADVLKKDGSVELTANWDAGTFTITASTFVSDIATGTAPFTVSSTTVVSNLNADTTDGQHLGVTNSPTFVAITVQTANLQHTAPEVVMQNTTEEDGDGGRESSVRFKGEQSGGELTTLAMVRGSHDGASDDEKGKLEILVNDTNDADSPTLQVVVDGVDVTLLRGVLALPETTTPTPVDSEGRFYTKSDNLAYFQDGAGAERVVELADYAGLLITGNAVATTVLLVDAYEPILIWGTDMPETISDGDNTSNDITIGMTGVYSVHFNIAASSAGANKFYVFMTFELAASGSAITGATQATPCVITAVAHGFSNGDTVKIDGVSGMTELNGQIYTVTNKADDTFELEDDNTTDIASGTYGVYSGPSGTAYLATKQRAVCAERKFAGGGDIGSMGGSGLATLTLGNTLELHVKGTSDASDVTVRSGQFWIHKV